MCTTCPKLLQARHKITAKKLKPQLSNAEPAKNVSFISDNQVILLTSNQIIMILLNYTISKRDMENSFCGQAPI
jgi:hypothetical protein